MIVCVTGNAMKACACDGEMVWFAGREGGGSVYVSLSLTRHVMEQLEQDDDFLSF